MKNKRASKKLSSSTARRLGALGLAGGAAVAATGDPAAAGINYFNVDPDGTAVSSTFALDLDGMFGGDLAAELTFTHSFPLTSNFGNATAQAASASAFVGGFLGGTATASPPGYLYVSNPVSGAAIANLNTAATQLTADPARNFGLLSNGKQGRMAFASATVAQSFQFMGAATGFVAFTFPDTVAGKPAFGWARVTVAHDNGGFEDKNTITVHDFAWSSDTAITAGQVPEPSAIGLLALGAVGIGLMRHRPRPSNDPSS